MAAPICKPGTLCSVNSSSYNISPSPNATKHVQKLGNEAKEREKISTSFLLSLTPTRRPETLRMKCKLLSPKAEFPSGEKNEAFQEVSPYELNEQWQCVILQKKKTITSPTINR